MPNNILKDFFYGNINPNEKQFDCNSEYGKAAAVVPAHEEGTGIIHTEYRAERTGEWRLGIIHPHQFHTGAGGIVPADTLHGIFIRKPHGRHLHF